MKINKCNNRSGFDKTFCKLRKEVCKKENHDVAKAGAKLYAFVNPAHAIVVPISEAGSIILRKSLC